MLIIPDTNKIACRSTIRSRNGEMARNVLCLLSLSFYQEPCTFPLLLLDPLPSFFVFIFAPLYPPDWRFHFVGRGDPSLIYLPPRIQPSRFVCVVTRLFYSYKYLMPFWKSHLTAGAKCISYRYRRPPLFRHFCAPTTNAKPDEFPGTLYLKVFTFYRLFANSGNLGCCTQREGTCVHT